MLRTQEFIGLCVYYLYENFGKNFPLNGSGIFFFLLPAKSCTMYKILVNFSLSLERKPGSGKQTNGTELVAPVKAGKR